jgi:hypothetical protein
MDTLAPKSYRGRFVRSRRDAEKIMALARVADTDAELERERAANRESPRHPRLSKALGFLKRRRPLAPGMRRALSKPQKLVRSHE